ncbi:class I SAM-dependent methyltransferase [Flavobacterium columnare]|uniref:Class I SAM-dependent methyltransferase n=1 Tax=Flavobacterium columnare TaxID=996 RepID=A0AAI8CJP5_9FLAO|nr:class I SAM-dependent methyltransferase [Flavobacterium columnare]AMO21483.1 class I SAM-dependent methyltransferase [Flavobacterium columnare]AUX19498.1 methyltransferase [Flavobacterium columnare]MEB3801416.1 class I SAM-dependent methyltransferase [Flavobacterium columnare]QOG57529.1 class I SAM-dependent methyltransferase [Flavobacterium columnare]QOG60253.1 class I SAM-dependent methyltransferase [Flavobacterium columnare]
MNFSEQNSYIKVKDHSVSNENFNLLLDPETELLKTHPQPSLERLGFYYESEDYISHTDGKRSLFERLYHLVKSYALIKKVALVSSIHKTKGVLLDIGAGTGDFLVTAKNAGWITKGFEPNTNARNLALSKGIELVDATQSISDYSVDLITMWHVLEHVPNLEEQIQELKRLLKPNGTLVIAVPNYKSYDAEYYGKYWAAYDAPRHLWHFSKKSIEKLFGQTKMKVIQIHPMIFDSFYVSLLSEKYKTGKMNFLKAFWIGLKSNIKAGAKKEFSSHIYIVKNDN